MRIAFLKSRARFRGGLEKYTLHLIRAFAEKGHQVTLLTTGPAPDIEGVQIHSLASDTKFSLYQLIRFNLLCRRWLRKNPQEIVFGMERTTEQTHYRAGSGVHALFLKRRKMIDPLSKRISLYLNPLHLTLLKYEKETFENPQLKVLFTNSHMVKGEILSHYAVAEDKIEVIHNGVEWEKWSVPFEEKISTPKTGCFKLLFVGNGYRRKGLLFLLKGLSQLKNENFELTVIGKDKDPLFFSKWSEKNGLGLKVKFLGPQKDPLPFYKMADALVIPSIYDPFANVTLEALAMGLFVISSRYNGGKEVLQDFSGTLIEELTSPESVAIAVQKAMQQPLTAERVRMIRQSIKHLDFSTQLDKILSKTLNS